MTIGTLHRALGAVAHVVQRAQHLPAARQVARTRGRAERLSAVYAQSQSHDGRLVSSRVRRGRSAYGDDIVHPNLYGDGDGDTGSVVDEDYEYVMEDQL
jgi:hypothetical protein